MFLALTQVHSLFPLFLTFTPFHIHCATGRPGGSSHACVLVQVHRGGHLVSFLEIFSELIIFFRRFDFFFEKLFLSEILFIFFESIGHFFRRFDFFSKKLFLVGLIFFISRVLIIFSEIQFFSVV